MGVAIQMSEHFVYIENQFFITSYAPLYGTFPFPLMKVQDNSGRYQDREQNRRRIG